MTWYDDSELETLRSFTERWAAGTLRAALRARETRARAQRMDRDCERMEDWSPTEEEVKQAFDDVWVEEHLLVVAAQQFYNWAARLVGEGSQVREPAVVGSLKDLRNTLEHLNEAALQGDYARPDDSTGSKKTWSLSKMPEGALFLGTHWGYQSTTAFGVVDVDLIERECRAVLSDIFDERIAPHVDWYIQMLIDQRRGK